MNSYRATIEYFGTHYNGFQKQNSGVPTIQNTLENILKKISGQKSVQTLASGRTDTGVHAKGQVIKFTLEKTIPATGLLKAMNDLLPSDIVIRELAECSEEFHPIKDSEWKEYHYRFCFGQTLPPDLQMVITNFFGEADINKMQQACKAFLGEHDFVHFQTVGTDVETTVRTILECEIVSEKAASHFSEEHSIDCYRLKIRGTGFLKQMVRLIMGTLLECGKGKVDISQINEVLEQGKAPESGNRLGPVAPPQGLILKQVKYPAIH